MEAKIVYIRGKNLGKLPQLLSVSLLEENIANFELCHLWISYNSRKKEYESEMETNA